MIPYSLEREDQLKREREVKTPGDISIWYGSQQRFGRHGRAQRWANILGNASPAEGITGLSYSLNGGPQRALSIGPDAGRLLESGDFNAEIAVVELRPGGNLVEIEAEWVTGERTVQQVTLEYAGDAVWPSPYRVNWREGDPLVDRVQVVEGRWSVTDDGLRPARAGYDRLLAVGDMSWTDCTVTVCATYNDLSHFSGFGILLRWTGHYADGKQPSGEWRPSGAIGWYRVRWEDDPAEHQCLNISDGVIADRVVVEAPPMRLDERRPYVHQFGVESCVGSPGIYRYRVWPEDNEEELLCDLSTPGKQGESPHGSALIIALHADVTIHWLRCEGAGPGAPALDRESHS